jgi:hypothetical protein
MRRLAMNPYAVSVTPLPDFRIEVAFDTGERRAFDLKPYLDRGVFTQLRDPAVFLTAHVAAGSVEWNGATALSSPALSADTLYLDGEPVEELNGASQRA